MKQLLLSISILSIIIITSCGSDDGVSVNNQITVGDQTFDIANGGFIDFGETEGITEGAFALSDANISISSSSFSISTSSDIRIIFSLASLGSGGLASGDYSEGDVLSPDAGKVFFIQLIKAGENTYSVTGGTIKLSGSSPNFTISFDLSLDGGDKLTGGFKGEFATN
ncbi:hypothetical protein [Ekhidna sp.]|jgi:hypothetical protein|uniref:hypothetical protein n=1 Tax=Ekhidna sp. TaxID=2608089 RepID=UPI0032EBDFEA